MNIDDFIEAADKDLEVDTSTRSGPGSLTPPGMGSPDRTVLENSAYRKTSGSEANKVHPQQQQFSPQSLGHQDHPLKVSRRPSINLGGAQRRSVVFNKRRSLIQPIVAPRTPDVHASKVNKSEPATLVADRANRQRSDSSASLTSIQAYGSEPDISSLLQTLATKELELLDGKHRIEELRKKLSAEDALHQERLKELQELKEQVSNHFQRTTVNNMSPTNNKSKVKVTELAEARSITDKAPSPPIPNKSEDGHSLWSKPLAILGQFDQIIQHEFERSLHWDEPSPPLPAQRDNAPEPKKQEEASVSRSIWNFVSDMKSGLLGIDEEVDAEKADRHRPSIERRLRRPENQEAKKLEFFASGMSGDEGEREVEMKEL